MKKNLCFFIVSILLLITNLSAQKLTADLFSTNIIHEEFNLSSSNWPTITSTDNYFIFDKGDYLLSRTNTVSEFAILAANGQNFQDFAIKTSIRIGPSDNAFSNLGLILKAQKDGKGAIIVEFNRDKRYRIKQLSGNYYSPISGKTDDDGWVKSSKLESGDNANTIEIRTNKNIYELYINSKYETTFFLNDYISGSVGIIIGPETKARVEYFYLNTLSENQEQEIKKNNEATVSNKIEEKQKQELEKLKSELKEKSTQLTNIENEKNIKQEEINVIKSDLETVKENLTVVKEQNKTLTESNKRLQVKINEENDNSTSSISEKQAEISALKSKSELANSNISALNSKLQLLKTKADMISDLEDKIRQQKAELNKTKSNLNDATVINKEKWNLLNSKISNLKKQISRLENENNRLNSNLSSNREDNAKRLNELKSENNALKKVKIALEDATVINKEKWDLLNSKISNLKKQISRLENENNHLNRNLSSKQEISKKSMNALKSENEALQESITKKAKEISSLTQRINTIDATNKNADRIKEQAKQKQEELILENQLLHQELATIKKQSEQYTDQINALISKNEALNSFMVSQGIIKNKDTKTITFKSNVEEKLEGIEFYSLQLGAFITPVPKSKFPNAKDIYHVKNEDGIFLYLSGEYKNLNDAIVEKNMLTEKGENNIYVVKVIDRRKVELVE